MNTINKLQWEDKYSVGIVEIDLQHQKMFTVINQLIDVLAGIPTPDQLVEIINSLIEYKKFHFATEEKYFKDFNYEGAEEHIAAHHTFEEKLKNIQEKNTNNTISLAYGLVDFLEDWLVDHLQTLDQKYRKCFLANGLK